jgi:RNA polymerase sigma-70 factor (ECF subfamily)
VAIYNEIGPEGNPDSARGNRFEMTMSEEDALIQAAKRGNLNAFNQLVLAYQSQVYALAYRLVGNRETAADVTQETFLSAFRHLHRFRKGSLRAWLFRIATNQAYDLLRKQRSRPTAPLEALLSHPDTPEIRRRRESQDPETYAERKELISEIQEALNTLPHPQRTAVVLCDVEGFSYREAADTIGVSLGTLKSRLSRGRARLREYFVEHRELLPTSIRSIFSGALDKAHEGSAPTESPAEKPEE